MTTTNIPMSGATFIASCKRWGLTVIEHPGWQDRNRNGDGRAWGPINGFVVHNFASDIPDVSSNDYLLRGDNARGMPGPLSQLSLDDEGRVHLLGWGRANHVGTGHPDVLARVINDQMPLTGDVVPAARHNAVSITHRFVGVEMLYGKAPTAKQRTALPRLCAAFLEPMGWAATSVIGHREISIGKARDGMFRPDRSDPVGFDMGAVRRQVQVLLRTGPGSTLSVPSNPKPVPEEDDMNIADIVKAVWEGVKWKTPEGVEATPGSFLRAANNKAGKAAQDAAAALAVARALAEKASPMTPEEVEAIVKRAIADSVRVTGELTIEPK